MAGTTEELYKNRKTFTGIDTFNPKDTFKFRPLGKINGVDLIIPDKSFEQNKGGMGWAHIRVADPTFTDWTIGTTESGEYTFEVPSTLKRIKNLYCMYNISASASSGVACGEPFQYFNIQNGENSLPRFNRDVLTLLDTGFEPNSESFTNNSGIKGFTSTLSSDGLSTTIEPRVIDLTPMLYENMYTLGNPTKIQIRYAIDTIGKCCTASSTVTISNIYFIFTEWIESDDEFKHFKSQIAGKARLVPYLYPFRIDIGSITSSTSVKTSQTIAQLSGRVPALFVGLSDSGTAINASSHIYSQVASIGLLDVNDQNIVFNWDISESQACLFAQKHGLSNALYTYKTHVIPYIFCKDLHATLFNHVTTGGLPLKLQQERIRILPASTATGSYSCIVFGFYYAYITLAPDGRMIGGCSIVDAGSS
jgi:hypothetical protein